MASSLGSLYIELKARTADFIAGMTQAQALSQRQMRQIKRDAADMQDSLETGFKRIAVAATAAAGGLAIAMSKTADGMYRMAIMAKQAGAPVDQFSALVEVADDAGVGVQAVNTGIQTLARNAASTSPQIQDYFKQLHIDPKAANSPVTLLTETLQAIQRIPNALQRSQAELLLLGRSGSLLEPLVREASRIGAQMQDQLAAGVALSPQAAAAAVAWHNTVDTLQDDMRAVVQTLVAEFQPTFSRLVDNLSSWIETLRQSQGLQTFINVVKAIADNIKLIGEAIAIAAITRFVGQIVIAAKDLMTAQKAFIALRVAVLALSGPLGWGLLAAGALGAAVAIGKFSGQNSALAQSVPQLQSRMQTLGEAIKGVGDQYGNAAKQAASFLAQQIGQSGFQVGQVASDVQAQQTALDKLKAQRADAERILSDPMQAQAAAGAALTVQALDPQIKAQQKLLDDARQKLDVAQATLGRANAAYDTARQHATMQGPAGATFNPTATAAPKQDPLTALVSNLQAASLQTGNAAVDQRAESIRKLTDAYDKYVSSGGNVATADAKLAHGLQAVNQTYTQAVAVQKDQAAQYMQSLQAQIAVQKQGYDQQIAAISQGPQEAQFQQQRIALVQQYTDRITELRGQMAILADQGKSTTNVQAEITAQTLAQGDAVKALVEYQAKLVATQGSFGAGFQGALGQLRDSAMNVAEQVNSAFTDLFSGLADAVANFVTTGKASFGDLVNSFVADMVRMEMRILESQILSSLFGSLMPARGATGFGGSVVNPYGGYDVFGLGGVRANGGPVAGGTAYIVGERGPELFTPSVSGAITPNAALSAPPVQVAINITNKGQPVQATQTGQHMNGRQMIVDIALDAFNNDVASGGRSAKTIQQRFGLARRGIPVGA